MVRGNNSGLDIITDRLQQQHKTYAKCIGGQGV